MDDKRKFLEEEIMLSVFSAAFSRGCRVYQTGQNVPEIFKKSIARKMQEQVSRYRKEKHLETLIELQKFISLIGTNILFPHESRPSYLNEHGGWITFGRVQKLLNLYLKYRWSLDWDMEPPPHCPIDRNVLRWVEWPSSYPSWTSPEFTKEKYEEAIGLCETQAKNEGQDISEWELVKFNEKRKS